MAKTETGRQAEFVRLLTHVPQVANQPEARSGDGRDRP
jgi:hypothetical protein